jgi:polyisoprenoid-binding protein YceI
MALTTWNIDPAHSGIHFLVRHMVISKVRGKFTKFTGAVELDEEDLTRSKVHAEIETASIDTGEPQRDGHLRSPDFLDAEKFPKISFAGKSIKKSGEDYDVTGDLTVHGVTRPITLRATLEGKGKDPWGNDRVAFAAKTSLDRGDYGLSWNQVLEAGGLLVGTKVEIEIEVEAIKAKAG